MADDFERLVARNRRAHRLLDVFGVTYFEDIHYRPAFGAFPPPLGGRVREGGGHESESPCGPPCPPLPQRKSGLPDLRKTKMRNRGRPRLRGGESRVCREETPVVIRSKPRQFRKRQLTAMNVHAAEFSAAVQGRKHLAGVEQAL